MCLSVVVTVVLGRGRGCSRVRGPETKGGLGGLKDCSRGVSSVFCFSRSLSARKLLSAGLGQAGVYQA